MGGEMREGNGGMTSDEKMKVERSRGRGEERRGAGGGYHANQCLAAPQANDPEAVCGGDRFEALEAQVARMVDQCAAVPGGRCHSLRRRAASFPLPFLSLFFSPSRGRGEGLPVSVSMFCILSRLRL